MKKQLRSISNYKFIPLLVLMLLAGLGWFLLKPDVARGGLPLSRPDFIRAARQGFGDRDNGWAWSMQWWRGHLYVGTNHAFHCAEVASLNRFFAKLFPYPPPDPDVRCPRRPEDLDLRAEIWRWTPWTNTWQRVYQSPRNVPMPRHPGRFIARDIGYRGMNVFREADGTEALYVAAVSAQFLWNPVPPPRILRSTDGIHFAPVPQWKGTVLGDFDGNGFRNQTSFRGRFYIVGGTLQGSGVLFESRNPALGNNHFQRVSPTNMIVSAVEPYNGFLYLGTKDVKNGYSVVKTLALGNPPYGYLPVVSRGGYVSGLASNPEILHMKEFRNRLYVGGNGLKVGILGLMGPAEVIRINPDDSWDVVVGYPRLTPDGMKFPISGFDAGFGNFFNGHMWRMEVFDDNLYVGTFDSSTTFKNNRRAAPFLRHLMGFDLFRTPNGRRFYPITTRGFGDKFNFGVRSLEATPYGLFLGTANYYYGLEIWRGWPRFGLRSTTALDLPHKVYLPLIVKSSSEFDITPPDNVETEIVDDTVVVSWDQVPGSVQYRVFRIGVEQMTLPLSPTIESLLTYPNLFDLSEEELKTLMSSQEVETTIWTEPELVGQTDRFYFIDQDIKVGQRYVYYVETVNPAQQSSFPSHIAPAPMAAPPVTFDRLKASVVDMQQRGYLTDRGMEEIDQDLAMAQEFRNSTNFRDTAMVLGNLRHRLDQPEQTLMTVWKAEDLSDLLLKLERRVLLVQGGVLQPITLD